MKKNLPLELDFIHEAHNCERVSRMFSHFSFLKVCVCACELNFIHEAHNCERVSQMFSHFSFLKVRDGAKN